MVVLTTVLGSLATSQTGAPPPKPPAGGCPGAPLDGGSSCMFIAVIDAAGSGSGSGEAGVDGLVGSGPDAGTPDAALPVGQIAFANHNLAIGTPPGTLPVEVTALNGSDTLMAAAILNDTDGVFSITDPRCAAPGSTCGFGSGVPLGTTTVDVTCAATGSAHFAQLEVFGANGSSDTDLASLACAPASTSVAPKIHASDFTITAMVASTGMDATSVRNESIGSGAAATLTFTAQIANGQDPAFALASCTAPTGCMAAPGQGSDLRATFAPQRWGTDQHAEIDLSSNDPTAMQTSIIVSGIGLGGVLDVLAPTGSAFTIGPLPLGASQTQDVTLHDDGNLTLTTAITGASAPFSTTVASIDSASGHDATFGVTCGSSAPTPPTGITQTIALDTPRAYAGQHQTLSATCIVANTHVQVMPTAFDFGEVRLGAPIPSQTLTITNPTASAVTIDSITLLRSTTGLALDTPPASTLLAPGASLTATLSLSSGELTDLDDPREAIAIDLDEPTGHSHLELAVLGRVVTSSSTIAPAGLDLGTACVGHAISAHEILTNTGTGILRVQEPTIDQDFTLNLADPTSYPADGAPIAAGSAARIELSPISTALGVARGTLTWADDVPSLYTVPVTVSYIAVGTAVSPLDLAFGTVPVGISSSGGIITIDNCDDTATTVDLGDVNPVAGTANAWRLSASGKVPLAAHQHLVVTVTFAPRYPDDYNASLQLTVNGAPTAVRLSGRGAGSANERTFYGCGCAGGGSPAGAVVLGAAGLLIIRRRRRGSS